MASYIVGDIQGCYSGLRRLLDKVNFDPDADRLYAVGDLIARGSESLETLAYLYGLGDRFETVLGNHDLHFLAVTQGIRAVKRSDQLGSLLASDDLDTYIHWLRHKPLALKVNREVLITHAGLYPRWGFKKILKLNDEVCQQLQSDNWVLLLKHMYGSQPVEWNNNLEGYDRWRFIINACTRMRFLNHDKELEFATKTSPSLAGKGLQPWFEVPNSKLKNGQQVVFGHWAALMGKTGSKQYWGLDTGYVWGHQLTLLEVEKNKLHRISAVKDHK